MQHCRSPEKNLIARVSSNMSGKLRIPTGNVENTKIAVILKLTSRNVKKLKLFEILRPRRENYAYLQQMWKTQFAINQKRTPLVRQKGHCAVRKMNEFLSFSGVGLLRLGCVLPNRQILASKALMLPISTHSEKKGKSLFHWLLFV